jgi:hypothetical protein
MKQPKRRYVVGSGAVIFGYLGGKVKYFYPMVRSEINGAIEYLKRDCHAPRLKVYRLVEVRGKEAKRGKR